MTRGDDASRSTLRVRVVPRAGRAALSRDADGRVRVHLTAPPVDGAANRALLAFLADRLGVPKRAVTLVHGERGRDKVVRIDGASSAELEARVSRAVASSVDKAKGRG